MRLIFFVTTFFYSLTLFAQTNWRDTTNGVSPNNFDTCKKINNKASQNLVIKMRHPQPLFIANGIVVSVDNLSDSTSLITNISVLKCPEAFSKFGYIAFNGAVIISTKQKIEVETLNTIRQQKFKSLKGNIIFALNGDIVKDTALKISNKSIKEIELLKADVDKGRNSSFKKFNCINIWTLKENERTPMAGLCRGIRITQN